MFGKRAGFELLFVEFSTPFSVRCKYSPQQHPQTTYVSFLPLEKKTNFYVQIKQQVNYHFVSVLDKIRRQKIVKCSVVSISWIQSVFYFLVIVFYYCHSQARYYVYSKMFQFLTAQIKPEFIHSFILTQFCSHLMHFIILSVTNVSISIL